MNTFSLILFLASILTGVCYVYDFIKFRPTRNNNLKAALQLNPKLSRKEQLAIKEGKGVLYQCASLFPIIIFVFLVRAFVYEPFRIPSGSMEPTLLPGDFIAVEKWSYGIKNPLTNSTWIETSEPQRGDVAVFKFPKEPSIDYIKRVIGLPGDEIVVDNKQVYLRKACAQGAKCDPLEPLEQVAVGTITSKGATFDEQYLVLNETIDGHTHQMQVNPLVGDLSQYYYRQEGMLRGTWKVPEGYYFVMGDNRDNSNDSRFWGFVPKEYMIGRTAGIWLSLEFERSEDDWLPSFIPSDIRFSRLGGID